MGASVRSPRTQLALYGYTGFVTQFFSAFTHIVFYFKLKIRVEVTLRTLSNKYDVPVTAAAPGAQEKHNLVDLDHIFHIFMWAICN